MARKTEKKGEERLLNPLKRKVLRKRIPRSEVAFGVGFVGALGAVGGWVASQHDAYDPAERDISAEALAEGSVEDTLYRRPLKPWTEPGAEAPATADLKGLPEGILDGGWAVDGRVETFNPENLYEKINGAAELYLRFGFQELRYVTLAAGALLVTLELYDQGAFPDALGLFDSIRDPDRPLEARGGATWYRTAVGAIGRAGPYVFKISGSQEGDETRAKADQLIDLLAAEGGDGERAPAGLRVFTEGMGKDLAQISYEKQDVFQYAFMKDVWFAPAGEGDGRLFFHQAASEGEASALFDRLVKEQGAEHEPVTQGDGVVILKHAFLGTFFAVKRSGARLFGVEGAADADAARRALKAIEEALPHA